MSNEQRTPLDYALRYATLDFAVIPIHTILENSNCSCGNSDCSNPGKHPRISGWRGAATTDREQIEEWWTRHPNSNIGIVTGSQSNLCVVDKDPRHGSDSSYRDLIEEIGPVPNTLTVETGGGGGHDYYTQNGHEVGNKANVRPGID